MEKQIDVNNRKRIVYGDGPKDAKIMIIGEAPGIKEDKTGRPFQGKSGMLLDKLLHKAGILRKLCYVTNVIKEKPKGNKIKHFVDLSKKTPRETESYQKYLEFLKDEIREVNPNVIIATGATPLYALSGKQGITKWRGSIIESNVERPDGNGYYKMVPVIHPAAALRQYLYGHYIAFDLRKAKKQSKSISIDRKDRNYILRPDFDEAMQYLTDIYNNYDRHAFDIEVGRGEVSCISFAKDAKSAISIPFVEKGREYFTIDQEAKIWILIGKILESREIESVAQNATFDATFLFRRYGIKSRNIHDTMIAQAIIYPDFPKDLGFITSQYTDIPYYKDEGKEAFNKGVDTGNQEFWLYNAKDSIVLMEAFPKQIKELEQVGNLNTYENQRRLIEPLLYMTELGINMDTEFLDSESSVAEAKLEQLEEELNEEVGYEINPRSWKQLQEYFYGPKSEGGLGVKPYKKNGRPTTDEGALIRLGRGTKSRPPIPAANIILEHRSLAKLKGTYLDVDLDEDARIRTSMNPVGTRFGRLSSRKTIFGTGANLQNQPPIMKKAMVPDKDHIVYDIDLGQAENRVVAYLGPEPKMIEAFENGIDIHSRTASYIFGIPEDEIHDMDEEGIMCEEIGTGDYTHRFWGKKANHAFNYNQGYKSFSYQVEIPEHDGKMIHSKYHSTYSGVKKFHNWVKESLKKNRRLENLFGRKYIFLDRWNYKLFEEAYAFIPQSTVADIINQRGLLHLYYNQQRYQPVKILNQVHDSIVIEISTERQLSTHARLIMSLVESLETPLEFRGRTFSIPCDMTVHTKNFKQGPEIENISQLSVDELTNKLEGIYNG